MAGDKNKTKLEAPLPAHIPLKTGHEEERSNLMAFRVAHESFRSAAVAVTMPTVKTRQLALYSWPSPAWQDGTEDIHTGKR